MAVILCLVVEELVLCDDLDHRQSDILLTIIIYCTCKLATHDRSLCDKHLSLRESYIHCLVKVLDALYLSHSEAAASVSRLHEHRKSEFLDSLLGKTFDRLTLAEEDILCALDEVNILEIALAAELIERDS